MIIKPKVRGFICVTAHPEGCEAHVNEWIAYAKKHGRVQNSPLRVLVVGSSTGFGLASRITAAFGSNASTIGVFYENPGEPDKPGTPGWYNTIAFERAAKSAGLYSRSFNGDAFSADMKKQVVNAIKADPGQIDLLIYSVAAPRRTHPETGVVAKSTLKPIGSPFTAKTIDVNKGIISTVTIDPASEQEIAVTVSVMGGEDWRRWVDALEAADALSNHFTTVAYSYLGPDLTWAIYRNGTIGRAKEDLEKTAHSLHERLKSKGGRALVSINKGLVTQASSAIPIVPLYISILYRVMKERELHEGCIEQIGRLFHKLYDEVPTPVDGLGRIRIDDWEMQPEVQRAVAEIWADITTENLTSLADLEGYRADFLKLFGFGLAGVDYEKETEPHRTIA